jgi:hypothetical protein
MYPDPAELHEICCQVKQASEALQRTSAFLGFIPDSRAIILPAQEWKNSKRAKATKLQLN